MEYIVYRQFNTKAICGEVNLPVGTICQYDQGFITYDGKALCVVTSENAHRYFAKNNDGRGLERGQLVHSILKKLRDQDDACHERWTAVENDPICKIYKRHDHPDNWLWNHAFYGANIGHLVYIWNLVNREYEPIEITEETND